MLQTKNLEEGKPIKQLSLETEATTEDSVKYEIKISNEENKLSLSTSYKKGLITNEYFSSYELSKLTENKRFNFQNIDEYFLFLKDLLDNNKLLKLNNKIKKVDNILYFEIPARLGIIKELKFEIKEKELNERKKQKNKKEKMNTIYLENEELKKKVEELKLENEEIKKILEETQKKIEEKGIKQIQRIKNLFKDSAIVKNDEKKMINDWIDPYNEKNITSELLFRTSVDGDNSNTFHNKCNNKGPTIAFIKTTSGRRIGGFTMISWTSASSYKKDPDSFIFSLDTCQKFVQYKNFDNAIYDNSSYGPTFGNHDIYIANGCKSNNNSYCNSNVSYGFYYSYNLINPGNQCTNFQVTDYEVYLIKINK